MSSCGRAVAATSHGVPKFKNEDRLRTTFNGVVGLRSGKSSWPERPLFFALDSLQNVAVSLFDLVGGDAGPECDRAANASQPETLLHGFMRWAVLAVTQP